ncbi:MAG TPA: APC family permease, partial [Candidatus Kapabacteria bacterium]
LNIRGVVTTGNTALGFAIALFVPFVAMMALGIVPSFQHLGTVMSPMTPPELTTGAAFATGLFVILWNYLGWDSISTISREIQDAPRVFPKALMIGLPLVVLFYLLPVLVGINAVPDISQWTDGSWPVIAGAIGGAPLRLAVGIGGLLSAAGLFVAGLLAASRIPFVLAADGYLPKAFTKLHVNYATPTRAILTSAAIYMVLSGFSFEQLAEVDVLLYSSALLLEFWALIRLRRERPELARPFKIPGGMTVVVLVALVPTFLIGAATVEMLSTSWMEVLGLALFALLSGWSVMKFRRVRQHG